MSKSSLQPIGLASTIQAVFISILWGGNIVSIRVGVDSIPPLWSAFWRMLIGVAFVGLWAWSTGVRLRPERGETRALLFLGVLFTVQIALLNSASPLTSPSYGVVILNTYAIFANLFAHFASHFTKGSMQEERITPIRAVGLAMSFFGVVYLALARPDARLAPQPLLGNLLMVSSALLLGMRQIYTRWLVQTVHPVRSVVWQMLLSVPLFLLGAILTEPPVIAGVGVTWQAIAAISYQGVIVAGICFIAWAKLLKKHSAGTLTMFAFLVPVFGIFLSVQIFGERLHQSLFLGTALVLTGVFVVVRLGQTDAE